MSVKNNILFIGGDARQLEMIRNFTNLGMNISLVGFDNLKAPLSSVSIVDCLTEELLRQTNILILPVTGVDSIGKINSLFTKEEITLTQDHINFLPKGSKIFVGISNQYLKDLCISSEIELYELMDRDDVAIYNSIPTVEGAIMVAIHNTDFTLHASNCTVLGFGRVGMSLCRTLNALGAKINVGLRNTKDKARAYEMGIEAFNIKNLATKAPDIQILFNTVPSKIVTSGIILALPHDSLIVDLASKPGGIDFAFAEKRGIKAILASGLPGIVAPKTAGRILSEAIMNIMNLE